MCLLGTEHCLCMASLMVVVVVVVVIFEDTPVACSHLELLQMQ